MHQICVSSREQLEQFFDNLKRSLLERLDEGHVPFIAIANDNEPVYGDPAIYTDKPMDYRYMGSEYILAIGRPAEKRREEELAKLHQFRADMLARANGPMTL